MKLKQYTSYFTEYEELLFYIIIGIISFIGDVYSGKDKLYNNCIEPSYTFTLLFLHHLFVSFFYFGWLSKHKNILFLHIISIMFVLIIQINNDYRCPSTDIVNKNCNITRVNYLRDFLYFINIKKNNLYYIYIFVSFLFSCIKLYNMNKS